MKLTLNVFRSTNQILSDGEGFGVLKLDGKILGSEARDRGNEKKKIQLSTTLFNEIYMAN